MNLVCFSNFSSEKMASEKERRDKTTKEREIHLEKERVPKMTTHVESLSEKVNKPGETPSEEEVGRILPSGRQAVGKFEMNVGEAGGDEGKRTAALELEEISKFRQQAQQNSLEAIKAAEERYQKAHGKEKDAQLAKDATSEKSRQGGYTTAAKDTLTTAGKTAADYTKQTAGKAKDAAVSGGETAVHYVGDKAVAAKEASVETGKGAAGYAGKKAAELKEKAMATGWGAAHYTSQKAVEATKAVAGAIQSTAEYTDEKVVDYTGRKREAAKQDLAAINKSSETKVGMYNNLITLDIRQ